MLRFDIYICMYIKTLHIRLKRKNVKKLVSMSNKVNFVWNYVNETAFKAWRQRKQWLNHYDFHKLTAGSSKLLKLHSATIQAINEEHHTRRKQFKRSKLKWRSSRNLNWIPFKINQVKYKKGFINFCGLKFKAWDSYGLEDYKLRAGCFSQDIKGNWYINVAVEFEPKKLYPTEAIGIDLGLKDMATYSDGKRLENKKWYRNQEVKLAKAQRAKKKKQVKNIHAKIRNQRKDQLHKESRRLVNNFGTIAVGNVNSSKLAKTKMAKSIYDVGWGMFKTMLEYKSRWASTRFKVVNEAYTTQVCSSCGCISGPRGLKDLGIREWRCSDCGASHDRDVNAAKNILTLGLGHEPLAVGISGL